MDMVYISHPYTGNEAENSRDAERIRAMLQKKHPETCYVMPIGMFGAEGMGYCQILACCLELEKRCDKVLFCSGWEESAGCRAEMEFALQRKMFIDYVNPIKED